MQTSFAVQKTDQGFQLEITFRDDEWSSVSNVCFTPDEKQVKQEEVLFDVLTKNGYINNSPLFTRRDCKELKCALKLVPETRPATIGVIDLKDKQHGYAGSCKEEIAAEERQAASAMKTKKLFQKEIDFLLLEGSLKCDILASALFTQRACRYLNSNEGSADFCQIAEYFMIGFKLGLAAKIHTAIFSSDRYIAQVSGRYHSFPSFSKSVVFYPEQYKEIYSQEAPFAKSLQSVCLVVGEYFQDSGITKMTMEKKL